MYKVFINDKPIILTDSLFIESDFELLNYQNIILPEILHKLKKGNINGIVLICINLENCWENFKKYFKVITAAGGLVTNKKNEFLFIFRGNKWDLPKGRIEKGENIKQTAIREVEEECGISELKLDDFLLTTYHIFFQKNEDRLKETHWFLMNSNSKETLTPQLEEGITKAEFKNKADSEEALKNTYANIHLVFDTFYEK